jgi:allene oxide cyclase
MRKTLFVGALALVVIVTGLTVAAAHRHQPQQIISVLRFRVVEHADSDTVTDNGTAGDSEGDLLTWHNPIYSAKNTKKIGHDQGECTRIDPASGSWECRWITWIAGQGGITVEGPFYDARDSVLAVTGGTGAFRNARGTMLCHARNAGGTAYNFDFTLLP